MPDRRSILLAATLAAFAFGRTLDARAAEPAVPSGTAPGTEPAAPPTGAAGVRKPRATGSTVAAPGRPRAPRPPAPLPAPMLDANGCGARDGVLAHGPRRERLVAVTFDACPTTRSPGFAREIVDLLEREKVPTTFFVSGRWAETHPADFSRLRSVPFFEIALHGHRHRHLVRGAPDAMRAEIEQGRAALRGLGADPVAIFRPPFGDSPPELAGVAERVGVTAVTWDVAPGDPDPGVSSSAIERGVTARSEPGSVVVLHVNGRGAGTPKALPGVLAGLRARGFRFARVSEVLAPCRPAPSRDGSTAPTTPWPNTTATETPTGTPRAAASPGPTGAGGP